MRIILLIFFIVSATGTYAQVGVVGFYNLNRLGTGSANLQIDREVDDGYEVAVNYWFRLAKKRVEFLPTLYYATAAGSVNHSEYGFQFKTNIYPFDFGTDCDCPTFGKQGPQLQKGFFLQLSPGLANHRFEYPAGLGESNKIALNLGAAVGLDIGLTNLLTLTPMVGVRHSLTNVGDTIFTDDSGTPLNSSIGLRLTTVQLGLQATFRFDKGRY